ncbi:hypothetical protein QFC21_003739 [Naganishia friedmannii]|uniref:Uncharacterized protein n=1 Tax=Naganishia friedmannii TaxID=89922 RepID=A0ACC2VKV7_9TREE|nr:hypothetical protein QFC21_003739 [Naganishia friedmannii]
MKHIALQEGTLPQPLAAQTHLRQLTSTMLHSSRIIVVAGAGISCASGIPDFRSHEGLYALCPTTTSSSITGQDLFSAHCLSRPDTLAAFNTFIGNLSTLCAKAEPTQTHILLRALEARPKLSPRGGKKGRGEGKGRLLRVYTQNIDGLEDKVGLGNGITAVVKKSILGAAAPPSSSTTPPLIVKLHGSLSDSRCSLCQTTIPTTPEFTALYTAGTSPSCPTCADRSAMRAARSARGIKIGGLRPALVLYDEPHPDAEKIGNIQVKDVDPAKGREPEMVIVMGTSLKVHGVKNFLRSLIKTIRATHSSSDIGHAPTHRIAFINKTAPPAEFKDAFDVWIQGDCDHWASLTETEWRRQRPWEWETQERLALSAYSGVQLKVVDGKAKSGKENIPMPPPTSITSNSAPTAALKRKREQASDITTPRKSQQTSRPPFRSAQSNITAPLSPSPTPTFTRHCRRIEDSDTEDDVAQDSEPERQLRARTSQRIRQPVTPSLSRATKGSMHLPDTPPQSPSKVRSTTATLRSSRRSCVAR